MRNPRKHLDIIICCHQDVSVRTTLTLDDDVADKVKQLAERQRRPFKQVLNEVLRRGLAAQERRGGNKRVRIETFSSAFRAGVDPMKLNQLSDDLESEHAAGRMTAPHS